MMQADAVDPTGTGAHAKLSRARMQAAVSNAKGLRADGVKGEVSRKSPRQGGAVAITKRRTKARRGGIRPLSSCLKRRGTSQLPTTTRIIAPFVLQMRHQMCLFKGRVRILASR